MFKKAYHLSIELEHKVYWVTKFLNFNLNIACEKRILQLNKMVSLDRKHIRMPKFTRNAQKINMINTFYGGHLKWDKKSCYITHTLRYFLKNFDLDGMVLIR